MLVVKSSKLKPQTPFQTSTYVINLILATGPFAYPYGFVKTGPILSLLIMGFSIFISQICATWVLEATAAACAELGQDGDRHLSVYPPKVYPSADVMRKMNDKDEDIKTSPFYMRLKLEYAIIAKHFNGNWAKNLAIVTLILLMYGAMLLKYVVGAESFEYALSYLIYKDECGWYDDWKAFDPYYLGLIVFASLSIFFSFGDLENAKTLQVVSFYLRFIVTFVMIIGSIIVMANHGFHPGPLWDIKAQVETLPDVFGNTLFAFIFHFTLSGIIYSMRP